MANILDYSINRKVSWYFICSYAYYKKNISLISDEIFDQLCKDILKDFDKIDHQHKYLLEKELLEAGTGFSLKYPSIVVGAAERLIKDHNDIMNFLG